MSASPDFVTYSDGGARGNPGPAASGFVIFDHQQKHLFEGGHFLGIATNNVAEYHGIIDAYQWLAAYLKENPPASLPIQVVSYLDSDLIVNQLTGRYKIKQPHLIPLAQSLHHLISNAGIVASFYHVRREKNQHADRLVNQILDAQK